ncbi:hypothetical protein MELA_02020 [Candidatus Methylomirabilis lanthanidiphila]|uniref:Glycine-zipper-containing OmpA-like membrane domain-containing protein n=1 Tax=Candidatus Methylomirabilis lanthanidiphila TaxID=2211376 RepID=A0A564ZJY7_9BACT|nr:hypothetical protein [Candidatus Methylomirabilis lanthanidiphila]VUZ85635.1 hypothetical protein MELA_02020 [Candidatus Methylomirabilis lanthanidiphila]
MKRVGVWVVLIVFGVAVTGCATTEQPDASAYPQPGYYVYPQYGQTQEQLNRDRAECLEWARQQTGYSSGTQETAKGAGVGAVLGALGGAAIGAVGGAVVGSAGTGAAVGAATGAVGGAMSGGGAAYGKSQEGFDRAYAACMTGRGYAVK